VTDRRRRAASPRRSQISGAGDPPADLGWFDTVRLRLVERETGRSLTARTAHSRQGRSALRRRRLGAGAGGADCAPTGCRLVAGHNRRSPARSASARSGCRRGRSRARRPTAPRGRAVHIHPHERAPPSLRAGPSRRRSSCAGTRTGSLNPRPARLSPTRGEARGDGHHASPHARGLGRDQRARRSAGGGRLSRTRGALAWNSCASAGFGRSRDRRDVAEPCRPRAGPPLPA
jgi:hypothetical protein